MAAVQPVTDFWQAAPVEGAPASEPTEVRVAYTRTRSTSGSCATTGPAGILVIGSRRDSPLDDTDAFAVILDTYRDRQNGFVFGTNP